MSLADWLIVAAIVLSCAQAAAQGFFTEAFALAGTVVGFLLAAWEYPWISDSLLSSVNPRWVADIVGFFVIFIAVVLLAGIAGRITSWAVREAGLKWMDRFLGAVFGLLRGLLVVIVVCLATAAFAPGARWLSNSSMAPYFLAVGRAATWLTPGEIRSRVHEGIEVLHRAKDQAQDAAKPKPSPATAPEPSPKPAGK
ncbi:MAG TPA: CvpA family protein [Terriglobales bacterium]|nr:CvpA family protein [Terriglobales bacterium]